jgi:hypothetical protein
MRRLHMLCYFHVYIQFATLARSSRSNPISRCFPILAYMSMVLRLDHVHVGKMPRVQLRVPHCTHLLIYIIPLKALDS